MHQIVEARNSVFQEMRQELNKTANNEIYKCNLTSQSVTKDKLIHWLETVCSLVEECQAVYSCFVGGAESPQKYCSNNCDRKGNKSHTGFML